MSYRRRTVSGGKLYHGAELQWQPTLTVHDPNPPIVLETPAGGSFTLVVEAGTYAHVGTAATLKAGRYVGALVGAYSESGTAATLKVGRYVSVTGGSYVHTGATATLKAGRLLAGTNGSYSMSGTDATLIYTPVSPTTHIFRMLMGVG